MTSQTDLAKAIWENRDKIFIIDKPYSKGKFRKHYKIFIGITDITHNVIYFSNKVNVDKYNCIWFRKLSDNNNIHIVVYKYLHKLKKILKIQDVSPIKKEYPIL